MLNQEWDLLTQNSIAEFKGTEESRTDSERQKLRYEMEDAQRRSSAGGFFQSLLG